MLSGSLIGLLAVTQPVPAKSVALVDSGSARAVIVTADDPVPSAAFAAEELREHIEKATGTRLDIITESVAIPTDLTPVYIGETSMARRAGLKTEGLKPDAFILRVTGSAIYILGKEDAEGDPLNEAVPHWGTTRSPYGGTLAGVYEFLDRYMGVRWLWPGELGTHIPKQASLLVGETDEMVEPALRYRRVRYPWLRGHLADYSPPIRALAFSDEGLHRYADALHLFYRRQRTGFPRPDTHHTFGSWWNRHGTRHPDWFMMLEEGRRATPDDDPRFLKHGVPMCVSNEELHRYIVETAWNGSTYLRLGEVDVGAYCHCSECMSWDGPQPEGARARITSDRYARFWQSIYDKAVKRNPDVIIAVFLYMHYFHAPLSDIQLSENILGEFTPWGPPTTVWYPSPDRLLDWQRAQWKGWADTGLQMIYRPNDMLAGYAMPHINIRQRADFFTFAYQSGQMVGADFDSLMGQWAVRGPEHYMAFRRLVRPDLSIDEVLSEYYGAFGPAADAVAAYFDYWEKHNIELMRNRRWADMWARPNRDNDGRYRGAPLGYPPEVFPPAADLLANALAAAQEDPDDIYAKRVDFLRAGLEHARLSVTFIQKMEEEAPDAGDALRALIAFRRAHEDVFIADYLRVAALEQRAYGDRLEGLLRRDDE